MRNTPRTDVLLVVHDLDPKPDTIINHARQLERELNAATDRIKRLRDGIAKQSLEIEQTCGKALDYPWFKDDQKNFPGATEKDGVCVWDHVAETIVAELARKYTEVMERIKQLESWIESLEVLEQHSGILPEREWFGSEIGYLRKGEAVYKGEAKP